jgi:CRP-like cAMP-binding protein
MGATIRRATAADAPKWLELVQATLGPQYPVKSIYDPAWVAGQLDAETGQETWLAEVGGRINASISFLKPVGLNSNPVANLGRNLARPESITDGSAEMLLRSIQELVTQRNEMAIVRLASADNAQQRLFENLGYVCVGFQPLKHMLQQRVGILFYVHGANSVLVTRAPLSESLPQVGELATAVLEKLSLPNAMTIRDGASGYPLQCEMKIVETTGEGFDRARNAAESANPPPEVSGRFNYGLGLMRIPGTPATKGLLGEQDGKNVAALSYYFDDQDRCARITEAFCTDDLSIGALLAHALRSVQEQLNAVYTEIDILATAPRLLKSAEQLGFVPVAYLPGFYCSKGKYSDVVKMVKLNLPYSVEVGNFTSHAQSMVKIIDRSFEDQKLGLAIINLLRPLSMFSGLGDGELRKIARLFVQKLYRPGEQVFAKGDSGDEAFIVLRGKIAIQLEKDSPAVAQLGDGKVFGELAFLDGSPRAAFAIASQPSILLVMKRTAFAEAVRREPNLGMVVMRNIAQDLAHKLRGVNEALANTRKPAAKA